MKKSDFEKELRDCDGNADNIRLVLAIQEIEKAGLSVSEGESEKPKTSGDTISRVGELINQG